MHLLLVYLIVLLLISAVFARTFLTIDLSLKSNLYMQTKGVAVLCGCFLRASECLRSIKACVNDREFSCVAAWHTLYTAHQAVKFNSQQMDF